MNYRLFSWKSTDGDAPPAIPLLYSESRSGRDQRGELRGLVFKVIAIHVLCLVLGASSGFSQEVVVRPVADTTLSEAVPNNNLGGNANVNAGTTQNFTRTRGLFEFDIAGNVPANATITSVTLTFEVTGQPKDGYNASIFDLDRMLRSWGEGSKTGTSTSPGVGAPATTGEATWNDRFFGLNQPWSAPGGAAGVDFVGTASASQVVYNVATSPYTFGSSAGMVADVQLWLNHPEQNNGWMLLTESESDNFTARRFASREDPVRAPILTLDYQIAAVPEPGIPALMALGWLGWILLRRSRALR